MDVRDFFGVPALTLIATVALTSATQPPSYREKLAACLADVRAAARKAVAVVSIDQIDSVHIQVPTSCNAFGDTIAIKPIKFSDREKSV